MHKGRCGVNQKLVSHIIKNSTDQYICTENPGMNFIELRKNSQEIKRPTLPLLLWISIKFEKLDLRLPLFHIKLTLHINIPKGFYSDLHLWSQYAMLKCGHDKFTSK